MEMQDWRTWGISEMEAIGKTWEKFLTIEGDALKSGGTDEFLSRKKNGLGARNYPNKQNDTFQTETFSYQIRV